jgi:hypothetical protein
MICHKTGVMLPPELLGILAGQLAADADVEVMDALEAILGLHPGFFAGAEAQEKLFRGIQNDSVHAFRLCLKCCIDVEIAPPLVEAFVEFAEEIEEELDPELHAEVAAFLAKHQ